MVQCPGRKPCILSQAMKTHEPSAGTLHNSYRTTWSHLEVPEPSFVVANAASLRVPYFIPYFTGEEIRGPEKLSKSLMFT